MVLYYAVWRASNVLLQNTMAQHSVEHWQGWRKFNCIQQICTDWSSILLQHFIKYAIMFQFVFSTLKFTVWCLIHQYIASGKWGHQWQTSGAGCGQQICRCLMITWWRHLMTWWWHDILDQGQQIFRQIRSRLPSGVNCHYQGENTMLSWGLRTGGLYTK